MAPKERVPPAPPHTQGRAKPPPGRAFPASSAASLWPSLLPSLGGHPPPPAYPVFPGAPLAIPRRLGDHLAPGGEAALDEAALQGPAADQPSASPLALTRARRDRSAPLAPGLGPQAAFTGPPELGAPKAPARPSPPRSSGAGRVSSGGRGRLSCPKAGPSRGEAGGGGPPAPFLRPPPAQPPPLPSRALQKGARLHAPWAGRKTQAAPPPLFLLGVGNQRGWRKRAGWLGVAPGAEGPQPCPFLPSPSAPAVTQQESGPGPSRPQKASQGESAERRQRRNQTPPPRLLLSCPPSRPAALPGCSVH